MEQIIGHARDIYNSGVKRHVDSFFGPLIKKHSNDQMALAVASTIGALLMTYVVCSKFVRNGKSKAGVKKSKKKRSKGNGFTEYQKKQPLTLEEKIDKVLEKFNTEYKSGIENLVATFEAETESHVYQCNFYNEMLLKLLIELDGIDLAGVTGERKLLLKKNRKDAIMQIQQQLKTIDKLRLT
ncbi:HDL075Wp [Eremothecium sinecaudum]|uniref:HDL075Wp n=1 Tax=Eremothecium sinecaudum TaxID=45286 RepID=A0A0X8HSH9_9SACH|nr:HDL075Wp [Eremothecium sinecaudum]AMD20669.1 HDL075Wp [Eremothecium sinecaudum]